MSYDDVWDNREDFGYEEGPPDYGFDPFFRSSRGREAPADFVDRDAPRRGPNMSMNDNYRPGRTSQSGPPPPHRGGVEIGADLRLDVTIDFKTAVLGGEKTVRMRHMETCGNRVVEKSKDIKVSIPPGVKNGNRLCIAGEGDVGPDGGPAGDLYIFLQVEDDPQFRVEGSDIYSEATISFADAILGAAITTPVVDGDVIVTVPPGTQPGFILRLKGKGATILGQSGKRGDHYVIMNIEIPSDLSLEDTKLVETLRENRMSKLKP
jgi:DnaJ-class molecular chaperone